MGCCGQKRAALVSPKRSTPASASAPALAPRPNVVNARPRGWTAPPSPDPGRQPQIVESSAVSGGIATIALRYLATSPLRLHGTVTARVYEFSAGQPVQAVAAPDALALLASRLFRRA